MNGYVFAWDLANCLDQSCGPEKLCLRAHNAMDPNLYCKDADKILYQVHLETAVMIQVRSFVSFNGFAVIMFNFQVAGTNGRIVISDFWDWDSHDVFQLESYVHSERAQS